MGDDDTGTVAKAITPPPTVEIPVDLQKIADQDETFTLRQLVLIAHAMGGTLVQGDASRGNFGYNISLPAEPILDALLASKILQRPVVAQTPPKNGC